MIRTAIRLLSKLEILLLNSFLKYVSHQKDKINHIKFVCKKNCSEFKQHHIYASAFVLKQF